MEYMVREGEMPLTDKLQVLTDAAKYDVACTSSGVERQGDGRSIGNCVAAGICCWNLPQLGCRWKVYFPSEDTFDQRVYIRL